MELGFWRWRWRWRAILALAALLLPIHIGAAICELPEFSHRKHSRWITRMSKRGMNSVDWSRIRSIMLDVPSNETNSRILHYMETLTSREKAVACTLDFSVLPQTKDDLICFADSELISGKTILSFPVEQCITDKLDGGLLDGAPWEVKLASRLLRERSRGDTSKWALYISSLPKYVPLPLFFTDMEMNNMEDSFVANEVFEMRRFAILSFYALRGADIAHAKFSDYVWALSIAFSLGCSLGNGGGHYLFPFLGITGTGSEKNAKLTLERGTLKVVASRNESRGAAISFYRDGTRRTDAFLFQGLILKYDVVEGARLFSGLNDVAEWFFSRYGGVNSNRVLTVKISRDAAETVESMASSGIKTGLSVNSSGVVAPSLLCVVASLFYAKKAIDAHNNNLGGKAPADFAVVEDTTWEKVMHVIAAKSLHPALDVSSKSTEVNEISSAFSSAVKAVQEHIGGLAARQTTDFVEDQFLLQAARWEGIGASAEEPCSACRWQIDKQGWNDVVAIGFRSSFKDVLRTALSERKLPSKAAVKDDSGGESVSKLKSFSTWMDKHGFSISEKLAITSMNDTSYQKNAVRGVLVSRDIEEGETLCILPLEAGLYDGSPESEAQKDSWDLAAKRLLQEKALGRSSKWADYIAILPRDMASPLYLDSTDLQEVQWMPVLREVIQVRRSIKKSFQQFKSPPFSFDDYKWAVIMVHSRAFTLPVLPGDRYSHYVLMPFMDMINHHYTYQADWMSQPVIDRKLEIIAKRALKKGDQLYASFGPRSNDNLFMYYGFVLEDNPFDSVQIFSSFEDATSWFIQAWTTHCRNHLHDAGAYRNCKRSSWSETWPVVKHAIDDFESGSSGQSKEWWELVSHWADIGYQYLPYQPGPNVYAFGISDPSLIAAFTAASTFVEFPAKKAKPETNTSTGFLDEFFACIEKLQEKLMDRPLLGKHPCQDHLVSALALEKDGEAMKDLVARVSVAIRCAEILATLPTSISQDLKLLRERSPPSIHIQLAREFRYRKKLQLKAVIYRVVTGTKTTNNAAKEKNYFGT